MKVVIPQINATRTPQLGRKERAKDAEEETLIIPDPQRTNWTVDGVPVAWINVGNHADALRYYQMNFPQFTPEVQAYMAEFDVKCKVKAIIAARHLA
jgi:hypothetical protein